jgi:hypothetical protein
MPAVPANADIPGLEQIWLHAPTQVAVSKRCKLIADASPRMGADDSGTNQFLLRSAIQHQTVKNLQTSLGFDSVENYVPKRNHENRLWQQLQTQRKLHCFTVTSRMRLEERQFSDLEGTSLRLRMMLKSNQKLGSSPYSIVVSDEIFFTLNTIPDGPVTGIDRNRLFAGLGYSIDRSRTLEAGYRIEYINKTDVDDEQRRQLVVQLNSTF